MSNKPYRKCCVCGATCWGLRCIACSRAHRRGASEADPLPSEFNTDTDRFDLEVRDDVARIRSVSEFIDTVPKALERAEVDLTRWYVAKQVVRTYQSPNAEGTRQLFAIAIELRPTIPAHVADAIDAFCERVKSRALRLPPVTRPRRKSRDPLLLEFSPVDHHFGKLAWRRETLEDYDLAIARARWVEAVEQTLAHWSARASEIERVVIPIGNDFLHTDNIRNETTRGTPMDVDGRWSKILEAGISAATLAVERFRKVAPVHVVHVSGNHDYERAYYVVRVLRAYYEGAGAVERGEVTFDLSPNPRKYVEFGKSLIGYTHGGDEPLHKLGVIMATEVADAWARTAWHEWHTGDKHSRKRIDTVGVDEHDGVIVRILPSLCGRDAWHHRKGYIGGPRSAESYLWSHARGYVGHFSANHYADEDEAA